MKEKRREKQNENINLIYSQYRKAKLIAKNIARHSFWLAIMYFRIFHTQIYFVYIRSFLYHHHHHHLCHMRRRKIKIEKIHSGEKFFFEITEKGIESGKIACWKWNWFQFNFFIVSQLFFLPVFLIKIWSIWCITVLMIYFKK